MTVRLHAGDRKHPHTQEIQRSPIGFRWFTNRISGTVGSGSHDSGDIACDIACNLMMLFADILFVGIRYAPRGCGR